MNKLQFVQTNYNLFEQIVTNNFFHVSPGLRTIPVCLTKKLIDPLFGVIISSNLKPSAQCLKAANKAMSVLGMVKRNFRRLDTDSFNVIYKGYIRPHLEFCIQAWSPFLAKDEVVLEKVQRRATKLVCGLKNKSYEERLRVLGLTTFRDTAIAG